MILRRLVKFLSVGLFGLLVYLTIFNLLINQKSFSAINFFIANVIAFILASLHNYFWHKHWTFRFSEGNQLFKFYETTLIGALINVVVANSFVRFGITSIPHLWLANLAALAGALAAASWNYLAYDRFVFIGPKK